eukprot:7852889-Lingulodinium_polyedra.AAC.1
MQFVAAGVRQALVAILRARPVAARPVLRPLGPTPAPARFSTGSTHPQAQGYSTFGPGGPAGPLLEFRGRLQR